MLDALRQRLIERPGVYLDEVIVFSGTTFAYLRAVRPPAVPWPPSADPQRHSVEQAANETHICETATFITSQAFDLTVSSTWPSPGARSILVSDRRVGLLGYEIGASRPISP